jgi:putative peptide zinc metalloprotease protein
MVSTEDVAHHLDRVPRRCASVELLGEYGGSGNKAPQFLVRRADGQVIQLTGLLFALVEEIDGERSSQAVATAVSERLGRDLSDENVAYLVTNKLTPIGVATFGTDPVGLVKTDLLLGLRTKKTLVSASVTVRLGRWFRYLFLPPVVIAVMALFAGFEVWFVTSASLGAATRHSLAHPREALLVLVLFYASAVFHELGHASACTYGGATPGRIGGGLYLVFPALYTDVTDSYRLDRRGRIRTDLGGIYFNALLAVLLAGGYALSGSAALLLAAAAMNVMMLMQLLPFVRLDGYWLVCDIAGVPDLFAYWGLAWKRLLRVRPRRPVYQALRPLRPATRRVILVWAAISAVVLAVEFTLLVTAAPALGRTMLQSLWAQAQYAAHQLEAGSPVGVALGTLNALLDLMLFVGLTFGVVFLAIHAARASARRWGRTPARRVAASLIPVLLFAAPMALSAAWLNPV